MKHFRGDFEGGGSSGIGNCLVATRMKRHDEKRWQDAGSCLGGNPKLLLSPWGQVADWHCIAQIDLQEVASYELNVRFEIPTEGVLAFFVDTVALMNGIIRGAIREVQPAQSAGGHERPKYSGRYPPYGRTFKGFCSDVDSPKAFRRWPLSFTKTLQEQEGDHFSPSLGEICGPLANSVHIDLEGFVAGERKKSYFFPEDDLAPFPQRTARKIKNAAVHCVCEMLLSKIPERTFRTRLHLAEMRKRTETAEKAFQILEVWQDKFESSADADAPVGEALAPDFMEDMKAVFLTVKEYDRLASQVFGYGTTMTADAGKHAFFEMYTESAESYAAIPTLIREQIEDFHMRTAYGGGALVHQLFGFGAGVQLPSFETHDKLLLLQITTDEAIGFEWGDGVGVAQFWIGFEDLKNGNWANAILDIQGG